MELGLYIHIPFCERKCYYCDFTSYINKDKEIESYTKSLIKELELYKEKIQDYKIKTIFIGGGTPSYIDPKYINMVLQYIKDNFHMDDDNEITIEVNPGTLTLEKARVYKDSGINRVSLGLQTTNNDMLKAIGRVHRVEDFYKAYDILKSVGIDNINVDLIFGLPNQSLSDVKEDLIEISKLDIKHISYYGLIIEPGTIMDKWDRQGKLDLPDEEEERDMYHEVIEFLGNKGYEHYEISNFAKKGFQCKHNRIYWEIKPYLGIGVGSHSNIANRRFWNRKSLNEYMNNLKANTLPVEGEEIIDKDMEIAEYCIMGIRFMEGINKLNFKERFGIDIEDIYGHVISKHMKDGLLEEKEGNIFLSNKGIDLANLVEVDFLP